MTHKCYFDFCSNHTTCSGNVTYARTYVRHIRPHHDKNWINLSIIANLSRSIFFPELILVLHWNLGYHKVATIHQDDRGGRGAAAHGELIRSSMTAASLTIVLYWRKPSSQHLLRDLDNSMRYYLIVQHCLVWLNEAWQSSYRQLVDAVEEI